MTSISAKDLIDDVDRDLNPEHEAGGSEGLCPSKMSRLGACRAARKLSPIIDKVSSFFRGQSQNPLAAEAHTRQVLIKDPIQQLRPCFGNTSRVIPTWAL
jgi:hypothetical protein